MKHLQRWLSILPLVLIGLSWWGIATARSGLVIRSFQRETIPLVYLAPQQAKSVPGVLIAHGYAGSKQLMLSYGHVLAHAGYAVMLWDFDGHGANPNRLRQELQQNLDVALHALIEQPEVDSTRLALLGHSMGSGIVMNAGIQAVDRFAATIAVSPTGAFVTPQAPRNLQLQAGSWEGGFVGNAERLLASGGGESTDFVAGTARELVIVPHVEHITILFSDASHQAALRWLNTTFNQTNFSQYLDRRMAWYGLHLLGWLLLLAAIAPSLAPWSKPSESEVAKVQTMKRWGGLLLAPVAGTMGLVLLNQFTNLQSLGGVQVGGAIGLWFLIAGGIWLIVLGRFPHLTVRGLSLGLALFGLLWVAFGAMAQLVWLQWWLIPTRLLVWVPFAAACLPWFLASGIVQQRTGKRERVGWWFAQSAVLIAGFLLTLNFLPQLGFMFLLLPLFPPLIAVLSFVVASVDQAWISAIASALFFGWILAAGFPLSS